MIQQNIRYISRQDGTVDEVILPITMFRQMVEELEDKELLRMMKEVERKSVDYLSEDESFGLLDSLIENSELQTQ
jgi:hypothetical protein